jgi:hypothetical protein
VCELYSVNDTGRFASSKSSTLDFLSHQQLQRLFALAGFIGKIEEGRTLRPIVSNEIFVFMQVS